MQTNNRHQDTTSRTHRPAFFMTKLSWWGGLLLLVVGAVFLQAYSYDAVTTKLAQWSGKTDRLDVFRNQYLTPTLFLVFRWSSIFIALAFIFTYRWLPWLASRVNQIWLLWIQLTSLPFQRFRTLAKPQQVILLATLGLLVIIRIYHSWLFPLQYDEAFTYVHLVHKGVLVSATYYPGPNNHVLFSIIAALLDWLLPPLFALRLPGLLGSLLLWWLLWDWLASKIRFEWAWLLATLLVLTPTLSVYAVTGRGYSLQLIATLIGFRVALAQKYLPIHRLAFVLSSVVGFYLVPTYLYVFITLVIFKTSTMLRTKSKNTLKHGVLDMAIIVFITSILYAPIILFNGLGTITHNGWVQPLGFVQWCSHFPAYLTELTQALWGLEAGVGIGIGFLFLLLVTFVLRPRKYFGVLGIALALLLMMVQQVLPPARTLQYLVLLLGWWLAEWLPKQSSRSKYPLVITLTLSASLLFYGLTVTKALYQVAQTPHPHIEVARKITSEKKPQKILVTQDTYAVFLQYFNAQNDHKHQIDTQVKAGVPYDWRIYSIQQSKSIKKPPNNVQLYLKNKEVVIYNNTSH